MRSKKCRQKQTSRFFVLSSYFLLLSSYFLFGCAREPEIKYPDTITIGLLADAKRLLPLLASDGASGEISGHIFNGLTKYDRNIRITGELAESWDISPDGLQIIFHLRKGVKWHDGAEFTSEDVLFTYQTVINPKVPTPYSSNYGPVDKVEIPDRYTVKVRYKEPYARPLNHGVWGYCQNIYLKARTFPLLI